MRVLLLRGCVIGRADERTGGPTDERTDGRTDGRAGGRAGGRSGKRPAGKPDRQPNRQTGRRTYGQTDIRADGRTDTGACGRARRPGHPRRDTAPGTRGAHRTPGTNHAATPLNGRHQPPAHALPRHPRGPPERVAGPRSHAGPPRGHRGRHPNGPAADTHRPGVESRSAAREDAPRPIRGSRPRRVPPPRAREDGAPGHDRRLPRLPTMTLHQPSDRQGPSARSRILAPGPGVNRGAGAPLSTDTHHGLARSADIRSGRYP
jgi:hypothetical protein